MMTVYHFLHAECFLLLVIVNSLLIHSVLCYLLVSWHSCPCLPNMNPYSLTASWDIQTLFKTPWNGRQSGVCFCVCMFTNFHSAICLASWLCPTWQCTQLYKRVGPVWVQIASNRANNGPRPVFKNGYMEPRWFGCLQKLSANTR